MDKIYIANDIECAGAGVGKHSILSWGACVVTEQPFSLAELKAKNLVFYIEIQPTSKEYEIEAMKIGCLGLECLEELKSRDVRYDPKKDDFDPSLVLDQLQKTGIPVRDAVDRALEWLDQVSGGREVDPVVDTVFFDSAFLQWLFAHCDKKSPYGWSGTDLDSLYRGYTRNMNGKLSDLALPDTRGTTHCALDDAIFMAEIARELIYNRMIC